MKRVTQMNTFIGQIECRVDDKGRVFVPATYRKILSEMGAQHLIMRRDTDNECIIFYPDSVWNRKVESLRESLDEWNPEDQMLLMQFMSDAEMMDTDSQGRILLSKRNLQSIQAEQTIVFVGMLDRFAIWNPEVFADKKINPADLSARIRQRMKQ
jgi:MraZ protein